MYGRGAWGRMFMKPEGVLFKRNITIMASGQSLPKDVEIGYELIISATWYNATKSAKTHIKKRDTNNLYKIILDACCAAIGIDDSQLFEERAKKVHSDTEGFTWKAWVL